MANKLQYLLATKIENGANTFGLVVEDAAGTVLGHLEGYVIDKEAAQIRFIVLAVRVGRQLRRRYLPFVPAVVDTTAGRVRLLTSVTAAAA
jgi:hypothetical protein